MHEEIKKELAALAVLCIDLNCEKFQVVLELCGYQIQTGSSIGMFTLYFIADGKNTSYKVLNCQIVAYTQINLIAAQNWLKDNYRRVIND